MKPEAQWLEFMIEVEPQIVCPYCGSPNQLDPALLCCGEVHAETQYWYLGELLNDIELAVAFRNWLKIKYPALGVE